MTARHPGGRERPRRLPLIAALLIAVIGLAVVTSGNTEDQVPSSAQARATDPDAGNGFGAYELVLTEAYRLATARGADWLELVEALPYAKDPASVPKADGSRKMDISVDTLSPAPGRIVYLYQGALADLTADDARAASDKVALLSHYYTDICNPLGTARSATERGMQESYKSAVEPLIAAEGGLRTRVTSDGYTRVKNVGALSLAAAERARLSHSVLVSAYRSGDFDAAALKITRLSITRAANDLADIITTLETARLKDVRSFGATGDGWADDTTAIEGAMKAAVRAGTGVYLSAGTYRVSTLSVPDGIALQGAGHAAAWIKGDVLFGSRDLFRGLKLGDGGARTHNAANATQTVFERCRFRGTAPIVLGDDNSCSYITFRDCLVERSFGGWTPDCRYNNVIIEEYSPGPYGHVEHIAFERCHVGVSNGSGGHDTGSPGGGLVCHVNPSPPYNQGYHDIKIIDCVFETTDEFTLDFDDRVNADGKHTASGVLIEGCTIKGGGYAGEKEFAYSICFEAPEGCVVRDNLIYRGYINTFKICKNEDPDPDRRPLLVEGNTFDLTVDNGVDTPEGVSMIRLHGDNSVFRDNTIISDLPDDAEGWDAPGSILKLYYARNTQITGNKVYDHASTRNPLLLHLYAASGNTVSSNYFWSKLQGGLKISSEAGSADNAWSNNIFDH
jgi:hypothetical protein